MEEQTPTQEQKPSPKTVSLKTYAVVLIALCFSLAINVWQKMTNDVLTKWVNDDEIELKNKDDQNKKLSQKLIQLENQKAEAEGNAFIYESSNDAAGDIINAKDAEKAELLQNMAKLQAQKARLQTLLKECYVKQQTP